MFPGCGKERKAWERSPDAQGPWKPQATGQTGGPLVQQKFMHASASELAASVLVVLQFRWRIYVMAKTKPGLFNPFSYSVPVRWA